MEIPRTGRISQTWHLGPRIGGEIAGEEIGFAFVSVVPALDVDVGGGVFGPGGTGAGGGRGAGGRDEAPCFGVEGEFVHVVEPVGSVESAEYDELLVVYYGDVSEASSGYYSITGGCGCGCGCGCIIRWHIIRTLLNTSPPLILNIKHPKIIQPRIPIVPPKQINPPRITNHHPVVLPTPRPRTPQHLHLLPRIGPKGEGVEIVQPAGTPTVSSKHVEVVADDDGGGSAAGEGEGAGGVEGGPGQALGG